MAPTIRLKEEAGLRVLGTRFLAKRLRANMEAQLLETGEVTLDFSGVEVTQSFVDELLGPLLLNGGEQALSRILFSHCSEDVRAVVSFVVSERLFDFESRKKGAVGRAAAC
jgi:hypothetical protein